MQNENKKLTNTNTMRPIIFLLSLFVFSFVFFNAVGEADPSIVVRTSTIKARQNYIILKENTVIELYKPDRRFNNADTRGLNKVIGEDTGERKDDLRASGSKPEELKGYKGTNIAYVSGYYTPIKGQANYFNGSYEADYEVNCWGDCFLTADGTNLRNKEPLSVAACDPKMYPLGTMLKITMSPEHKEHPNESFVTQCHDVGGAIKGGRIDIWLGIGEVWWGEWSDRNATVTKLSLI